MNPLWEEINKMTVMEKGAFVISLDFEMMWGVKDIYCPEGYGKSNIKNVKKVITSLVDLFNKYNIRATFATVGLIMLKDKNEALENIPKSIPSYINTMLSPYTDNYIGRIEDKYADLYFAPSIVDMLKKYDNIEIGTHTFCHYNCYDKGQTIAQFEEDIKTAIQVAKSRGINMKSIVFPRNQVSNEYLTICAKYGIEAYRGTPDRFFARTNNSFERAKNRIGRLLDNYICIGGRTTYKYSEIDGSTSPVNIRASRFFRPFNKKLFLLEPLSRHRMKKEMEYAACHNEVYHLWWHPHNFGANLENNMTKLEYVLKCYKTCHEKYGMNSYSMSDLSNLIKEEYARQA